MTKFRQNDVTYTANFAKIVHDVFGPALMAAIMRELQNRIHIALFGADTETLREMARAVTGSTAQKPAHRDTYADETILRITTMTNACALRMKILATSGMTPVNIVKDMNEFIEFFSDSIGGVQAPIYKDSL